MERLFKVKLSTKGQLVIPKNIRDAYSLQEGDEVLLIPRSEGLLVKRREGGGGGLRGLLKDLDVDVEECESILEKAKRTLAKVRV